MFIELELQSDRPIFAQIAQQIVEGIASGELNPGDAMPSVRSLASDLGINLHTVNKAYQVLKQDGFLQVHRKKGVVVQPGEMPGVTEAFIDKLHRQLRSVASEAVVRGMSESEFVAASLAVYRGDLMYKGDNLE
ncbi:GntR family transcriptional regulator [Paenibacillus baekrokdamisoli]|uniref:GntR family transcriptional regulator n=1 Tax=Paenibacillus baekrokdamisoli TaxID=1712516 RepID=A0A3G9JI39_9BACL|nr:GntR family transcriptional regulator [Paenibacillus baekrokdamisoli]MBB3068279.1 DNA-binding transcriptional regulator YhcF (GntR family) [Paenibacillus baekrokdamisoli]BBH22679.1 GntR family transcriptional regulator [Paenibacillus baekrokdamisoli]